MKKQIHWKLWSSVTVSLSRNVQFLDLFGWMPAYLGLTCLDGLFWIVCSLRYISLGVVTSGCASVAKLQPTPGPHPGPLPAAWALAFKQTGWRRQSSSLLAFAKATQASEYEISINYTIIITITLTYWICNVVSCEVIWCLESRAKFIFEPLQKIYQKEKPAASHAFRPRAQHRFLKHLSFP